MTTLAVTGHIDLTEDSIPLIRSALADLLTRYTTDGRLIGVSCLANGADSLFAEAVLTAGGHLIAGAIRLEDRDDTVGQLRPGEVVEVKPTRNTDILLLVGRLEQALKAQHLEAVPVGRLMRDAGAPV